jgi:Kae1-associated kinase Bud32
MRFVGAEAVLDVSGREIRKNRVKKGYRITEIDSALRSSRTKTESKIMRTAKRIGVHVPDIAKVEENTIYMDFIDGQVLRDVLDNLTDAKVVCNKIGWSIARMHDYDIIHGDLTTSNMILKDNEVWFIDFGLSSISKRIEDRAVDLHLLKEALEAKHTKRWEQFFEWVLGGYKPKQRNEIITRMHEIERRGRYK